jgi:DNA polymerase-3 subunit delta'
VLKVTMDISSPDTDLLEKISWAIAGNRLPHAILFCGRWKDVLEKTAEVLATRLLGCKNCHSSTDYFPLRPRGKMRQISMETVRTLLGHAYKTSYGGGLRVVHVCDADRLHRFAANALLKVLEEPPPGTVILLTTTRPYEILPTIRSRCHFFRSLKKPNFSPSFQLWENWLADYGLFLRRNQKFLPEHILDAYILLGNFRQILEEIPQLPRPPYLADEESVSWDEGQRRGLREQLLRNCAETIFRIRWENLPQDGHQRRLAILQLAKQLEDIDRVAWLLAMNAPEPAALEKIFLPLPPRIPENF